MFQCLRSRVRYVRYHGTNTCDIHSKRITAKNTKWSLTIPAKEITSSIYKVLSEHMIMPERRKAKHELFKNWVEAYPCDQDIIISEPSTEIINKLLYERPALIEFIPDNQVNPIIYDNALNRFKILSQFSHVGISGLQYSPTLTIHQIYLDMIQFNARYISRISEPHLERILSDIHKRNSGIVSKEIMSNITCDVSGALYNKYLRSNKLYRVILPDGKFWEEHIYSPLSDNESWEGKKPRKIGTIHGTVLTWDINSFIYHTGWQHFNVTWNDRIPTYSTLRMRGTHLVLQDYNLI